MLDQKLYCVAIAYIAVFVAQASAQSYVGSAPRPTSGPYATPVTSPSTTPSAAFKPEEIEQVVAPIALYPDSLLAQVLMASTYPLEVVQAERAVKENPKLKDSADALNKLSWDPSVKSLVNFPQVLTMMSEKLDWTVKLGDAFIADQKAVMDAVQRLRNKAYAEGNLKTTEQQKVSVQPTTAPAAGAPAQVIVLESASPSVVYVPTYNPTVVYGGWPYPSYPPYYYSPPGYVAGAAFVSFGVGVAVGAAWGHAWGDCDWNGGDVEIDIDKNVNFNGDIDREQFKAERDARQTDRQGSRDTRQTNRQQGERTTFQHDATHRQGVAYRDSQTTERFRGTGASQNTAQAREAYRGRTEMGRQDLARGGASGFTGSGTAGRTGTSGFQGTGTAGRTGSSGFQGSGVRQPTASTYSGTRSSGYGGIDSGGAGARASSSRGQYSRSSSSYSGGGSRSSSGGGRSYGGGGARGGGGRGGGGRR